MARSRSCSSVCLAASLLAVSVMDAEAQRIHGRISDARTEAPLANAQVRLVDDSGTDRAVAAADSAGRYELTAPGRGRYRVRAEQFGYEPRESAAFTVDGSTEILERDLVLTPSPIPIAGVEVTTDVVDRRIRQFLGMSPRQLRLRPVRSPAIRDHAMRGSDLTDLMSLQNIPNFEVLRSRAGPCFQFRARGCLPVYLDGAPLSRGASAELPLEVLNSIVILLPNEVVAYPAGAVVLFTTGYMR